MLLGIEEKNLALHCYNAKKKNSLNGNKLTRLASSAKRQKGS